MLNKLKKLIIHKNNGNITSLLIGQSFMILLLIWCLFNYRLTMLNTLFNYVDDALTSSCLGAALINTEEYGKSNQLVIHENDEYIDVSYTGYNGWTGKEADILLSEFNYGSDIEVTYNDLEHKTKLDINSRKDRLVSNDMRDYYLRRSASALKYCLDYNLSNGQYITSINPSNESDMLSNVSPDSGILNIKSISKENVIDKSFLGNYIISDVKIKKFEIYSVYRQNLAKRHIYASEFMQYGGKSYGQLTPSDIENINLKSIKWVEEATTLDEFKNLYEPHPYELLVGRSKDREITEEDYSEVENDSYSSEVVEYNKKLKNFSRDIIVWGNRGVSNTGLECYTDTHTTYQGDYNSYKNDVGNTENRVRYNNFFTHASSGKTPLDSETLTNPTPCKYDEKAPVSYWTCYSLINTNYKSDGSSNSTDGKVTFGDGSNMPKINSPGITYDGCEIENSSIYVEMVFTLKTFPTMTGVGFNSIENTTEVTVARLIDIEINTDQ